MAVSASDITGARATQNFEFEVLEPGDVGLEDVFAVPNPFRDKTHFVFKAHMGIPLDLKIDIYTIAGRKIKSIENSGTGAGIFWQIEWDGRDDDGDEIANGVYFFKVKAKNLNSGTQEVFTGKLVKMK
jgi:hypothetical protein